MKILKLTRLPKEKDEQVAITIREMIGITIMEAWDRNVRWLAHQWSLPSQAPKEFADMYNRLIRQWVRFQFDPKDVELIRLPSYYARAIQARNWSALWGDCDDSSLLLGTLLFSRGINVRYVTISQSPINREFRHVFVSAEVEPNRWESFDPAVPVAYRTDGLREKAWPVPFAYRPPRV